MSSLSKKCHFLEYFYLQMQKKSTLSTMFGKHAIASTVNYLGGY
jgi:hypothetical protein